MLTGTLGARMPQSMGAPEPSGNCNGAIMCFQWGNVARVEILECEDWDCFRVSWTVTHLRVVEDCLGTELSQSSFSHFLCPDIGSDHWYGGPEELVQHFPMRPDNQRRRTAYLPGDMLQVRESSWTTWTFLKRDLIFRTGRNTLVAWLSQCGSQAPGRA